MYWEQKVQRWLGAILATIGTGGLFLLAIGKISLVIH